MLAARFDAGEDHGWQAIGSPTSLPPGAPVSDGMKMRHFMDEGGKAFLDRARAEVRGVQSDLVGDLAVFVRANPALGEMAVGFLGALHGDTAGPAACRRTGDG